MSRQLALLVGKPSPRGAIAFAVMPYEAPLDAAFFIVVPWIIRAPLPVQLAFQATLGTNVGLEFLAQGRQSGLPLAWHNGDGRGTQIKPGHLLSNEVLGFPVGSNLKEQLHAVTVALYVCILPFRTGRLA